MLAQFMNFFRRRNGHKHDHARNNGCESRLPADREELERLALEEARRYESDLRKLAKT